MILLSVWVLETKLFWSLTVRCVGQTFEFCSCCRSFVMHHLSAVVAAFFLAKDPTPSKPCSVISRTCQSLGLTLCRWLSGSWSLYTVKRWCLHVRCPLHVSCFNALQRSEGRPVKRGSGRARPLKKLAASHVQKKPSTRVQIKPSTRVQKKPSGRVQSMQKKPAKAALLFSGQNAITPFFRH